MKIWKTQYTSQIETRANGYKRFRIDATAPFPSLGKGQPLGKSKVCRLSHVQAGIHHKMEGAWESDDVIPLTLLEAVKGDRRIVCLKELWHN